MNNNNNDKKAQSREEDEAAIRRIINGDKEAYFILQKKYKSIIASHIRKLINDEDDIPTIILIMENKLNNIKNTLINFSKSGF